MTDRDGEPDEVERLVAARRAANPRHSPGREPAGARSTRLVLAVTAALVGLATLVLLWALLLG